MGWKAIKEHYRIEHHVQVDKGRVCIGSSYCPDIIVIGPEGTVLQRYADGGNEALRRYQAEMDADPGKLKELLAAEDQFSASVPVFTYDGARIIEKRCEKPGWPNVTHDGLMMYENTFSTSRDQVVAWAKQNAAVAVRAMQRLVDEARERLAKYERELADYQRDVDTLEATEPSPPLA